MANPVIVIQVDADFTPFGKRSARVVQCLQGHRLRWYVSGQIYRTLSPTPAALELTKEWLAAGPQPKRK